MTNNVRRYDGSGRGIKTNVGRAGCFPVKPNSKPRPQPRSENRRITK